jgi:hypothetical protein
MEDITPTDLHKQKRWWRIEEGQVKEEEEQDYDDAFLFVSLCQRFMKDVAIMKSNSVDLTWAENNVNFYVKLSSGCENFRS